MDFAGKALPLTDGDVRTIAGYLGCEIACVRAVLQIEAAGKGFDSKGRPKMLFEPHIFYRELGAGASRDRAVREGLAYSKWKSGAYPSDSYPRLAKAIAINQTAALRSASWNLGQVMGFNHEAAGFDDVASFVEAMKHSEGAGLYAMARFIVSKGLQGHLRNKSWSSFAKGYNGSGYAKHGYHTKLASAYAKRPVSERVVPPPATEAQLKALIGRPTNTPVPAPFEPTPFHPKPATTYTVVPGDNWTKIAKAHDIGLDRLLAWNDADPAEPLMIGRVVRLTGSVLPASPAPAATSPAPTPPAPPAAAPEPAAGSHTGLIAIGAVVASAIAAFFGWGG